MWKQRLINLSVALVVSMSALAVLPFSVQAALDTCSWTGSTSANWSDGSNWSGCDNGGVPENGDTIVFPEAASNKSMNNDLVGLVVGNVGIGGNGYVFGGNGFSISGSAALDSTTSVTINAPVTFTGFNIVIVATTGNTITFNGTTTFASGGGEVNIGVGGSYTGTVDFVGNVEGSAATQFIAVDGAKVIVRGAANTYTATTVGAESGATFECRSATCFGSVTNDIYMGNGLVNILVAAVFPNNWQTSVPSVGTSWLSTNESISITGSGTVNDPLGISQDGTGKSLQFTGPVTLNNSASLFGVDSSSTIRFDGNVSGTGAFSIGTGSYLLNGFNTFSGTNTINSGAIVTITNEDALGNSTGITNVLSGGVLRLDFSAPGTINEPLEVNGSGQAGSGAVVFVGDSLTLNGDITLNGNTTFAIDSPIDGQPTMQGDISGAYSVTYEQRAGLYGFIVNSGKSYTGSTTINGTFVRSAGTNAIPSADVYVNATATSDAELQYFSNDLAPDSQRVHTANNGVNVAYVTFTADETVAQVDGSGDIELNGTNILNSANDYAFSGNLQFNPGTSILRKSGTGTATFSGTAAAPVGSTPLVEVNGGSFVANGNYGSVAFNVNNGGTLKGSGTLGATTVNAGGTFATGNSPGCITTDALTLTAGSTFQQEITGTTPCTQYDRTTVNGTVADRKSVV